MFDLEKAIGEWRQEMMRAGLRRPEVLDELEVHLREQIEQFKKGLDEEDAFHAAAGLLGGSKELKAEFSKIRWSLFAIFRDNPVILNLIAGWLILFGLNAFFANAQNIYAVLHSSVSTSPWVFGLNTFFGLQIVAGGGLLLRRKYSRYFSMLFFALNAGFLVLHMVQKWSAPPLPAQYHTDYYTFLLGMRIHLLVPWVTDSFILVFLVFSFLYLALPATGKVLFSNPKIKTA